MSEHPNAIIVRICAKAGLKLIKGQAAKIQAEVPDLRPEAVLEAARALRAKAGSGKGGTHPCPKNRIRAFLKRRVDGFLSANPHLDVPTGSLVDAAVGDLAVAFPEAASGPVIPEEDLDRALTATATRIRERAAMNAWFAGLKGAKLILRDSLTPELWRAYEGRLGELDDEVRRRSLEALAGWGAEEVPNPDRLTTALTTPLPVEGPDPVAEERRDWARVWDEVLLRVEGSCGPETGTFRRSRKNRLTLLSRMFHALGGPGSEKDRVAALDALIRERETEGALRRDREAEADRARRAWEARLVRRDELETLLPATKTETLRWIGDGRIPVAMRRDFRKWGKDLQVTMHDPDKLPEWRAKLETWRAEDASSTARKAGDARARAARETRVRNLVKASLPDGTDRASLISINKVKDRFAADLFAPVELPVRDGAAALSIRVPMRLPLPPKLWAPVAEGPVTGQARKDAISAIRGGLPGLMTAFRAEAAPGLAALGEELLVPLSNLPTEMVETFITGLEGNVLRSGVGGRDPSRLAGFLRQHASQTLNRVTELHRDRVLSRASGLADYPALFPQARLMRRQIHLHLGPTNSGKTHAAIERLLAAETGLYAAPLRLMAMEWADRLNGDGVPADLVTGEEVIRVEGARHQSVTIEMSPLRTPIEVAVIDEAQLIADEERGWAWTQAILGLPARELHLTGSPDAEPWTRYLAEMTGDELIVHRYERLVPLEPERGPVPIEEVRPGDAIIAFSRARVLQLREDISAEGHEVATVYGALSPEVRREEARRFRDGEADVLVATDAIGMGLNLPVRRVLLSEGEKFDGFERRPLTGAEIRQIVGRAGRFGLSEGEVGLAGVYTGTAPGLGARIQDQIERALRGRPKTPELTRPRVKPGGEVVRLLGELMGTDRLTTILHKTHHDILGRDEAFRSGITEEMVLLASVLDRISMPLEDRFAYVCAPVDTRDELCWDNLMGWTRRHEAGETVPYQVVPGKKVKMITTEAGLSSAESRVKATGLYLWCAHRWPDVYSDTDRAVAGRAALNRAISAALQGGRLTKSCRDCGDPLPVGHRFAICDECHQEMRGFRDWD
jgi:ATP-dependent RNA helicase SUPV3L1/SUV3